ARQGLPAEQREQVPVQLRQLEAVRGGVRPVRLELRDPPREFGAGTVQLRDCAAIELEPFEQVTFVTAGGGEYDVARTPWGFYATPSLNGRLPSFGLRGALARNAHERYYVLLVERGFEDAFDRYCEAEGITVVAWLDEEQTLNALAEGVEG